MSVAIWTGQDLWLGQFNIFWPRLHINDNFPVRVKGGMVLMQCFSIYSHPFHKDDIFVFLYFRPFEPWRRHIINVLKHIGSSVQNKILHWSVDFAKSFHQSPYIYT